MNISNLGDLPSWIKDFADKNKIQFISVKSDQEFFGDFEIIFELENVVFKVISDRAQIFIDIWDSKEHVWKDLLKIANNPAFSYDTPGQLLNWIRENLHVIKK